VKFIIKKDQHVILTSDYIHNKD